MKLRRRYKFRPYRIPRPRRRLRDSEIWVPVAVLIPIIALALTIRGCLG